MMSIREKQGVGLVLALVCIFMVALLVSVSARSEISPAGLRLIQTSENHRQWMTGAEIAELSHKIHSEGHCGGFMDVTDHPDEIPAARPMSLLAFNDPSHHEIVNPLLNELSATRLLDGVTTLSNFKNRSYNSPTGVAAATWIKERFTAMAHGRTDVKVEFFNHSFKQPSVIVTVEGKGPNAKEMVILGAHEDTIIMSPIGFPDHQARAPGADDDASGVATLLETFRVLMAADYQPDKTLVFMTYAGEEAGLLGSQDIARKYRSQGKLVSAVLQLDMTMYPGKTRDMTIISDHVDPALTRFTEMLIDTYVKVPWREATCRYACSDHASWTKAGYPAAFPFEAPLGEDNPKIHTENDTIANGLDSAFGLHFAKLAVAFAVELATE